jgi:hypothetical protein
MSTSGTITRTITTPQRHTNTIIQQSPPTTTTQRPRTRIIQDSDPNRVIRADTPSGSRWAARRCRSCTLRSQKCRARRSLCRLHLSDP